MSLESSKWLNTNTLIGYGRQAWHFNAADQGDEPNHYPHAIPAADVARRLFHWTAEPVELGYTWAGQDRTVARKQGLVRSDNGDYLGDHSLKYGIHQFQDSLLGGVNKITNTDLGIESAGLLSGGAIGWVSVSLADIATVRSSGVDYVTRLLAFGSHNGKFTTSYKIVNQLVVCDNTLAVAVGENNRPEYKVKHTLHSALRIESAQQALGLIVASSDAFDIAISKLLDTPVNDGQFSKFVQAVAPISEELAAVGKGKALTIAENKRERITELYNSDPRVAPWKGTAFGAFQAVNTWQHWDSIVRGAERQERNTLAQLDGSWEKHDGTTLEILHRVLANA